MNRTILFTAFFLLMTTTVSAQDYGQAATVRIWDNATAPHSNGITSPEQEPEPYRIANTSTAELFLYPADTTRTPGTGLGVVICPGGGYARLAIDHEGFQVAQWLAANGITAAVLKYRMPNGHPEVLDDLLVTIQKMMKERKVERYDNHFCPRYDVRELRQAHHQCPHRR